jgi:hypothetical protein
LDTEDGETATAQGPDQREPDLGDGENGGTSTAERPVLPEESGEPDDESQKTEDLAGKIDGAPSGQTTPEIPTAESSSGQTDPTIPPVSEETSEAGFSTSTPEGSSDTIAPQDLPVTGRTSAQQRTPWWMVWMALGIVSILLMVGVAAASGRKTE